MSQAAYLDRVSVVGDRVADWTAFPFNIPFVRGLDLRISAQVTFFVGENGSGKSTLLEAIAALCDLPVSGGGRNDIGSTHGPSTPNELSRVLRPSFRRRPRTGYFFRAELQAHFADLLDERKADPHFGASAYARYGGRSLHTRSHGEAFLAMFNAWLSPGMILMDEPESALSPQRQLVLLAEMANLTQRADTQFVIATHSPILLTFPGATIVNFDDPQLAPITLAETSDYQITKGILAAPERYWRHLRGEPRE
jgi:predicted ATPase